MSDSLTESSAAWQEENSSDPFCPPIEYCPLALCPPIEYCPLAPVYSSFDERLQAVGPLGVDVGPAHGHEFAGGAGQARDGDRALDDDR